MNKIIIEELNQEMEKCIENFKKKIKIINLDNFDEEKIKNIKLKNENLKIKDISILEKDENKNLILKIEEKKNLEKIYEEIKKDYNIIKYKDCIKIIIKENI